MWMQDIKREMSSLLYDIVKKSKRRVDKYDAPSIIKGAIKRLNLVALDQEF
jgi:hypothetical protein